MARRDGFTTRGRLVDTVAAAVLAFAAARGVLDPPGPAFPGPAWTAWLAGAAVALPLAVRRRWPLPVLGFLIAASALATALGAVGTGVVWLAYAATALALYTAATATGTVTATVALAASLAAPAATIPWLYVRTGITPADAPRSEVPLWWQVELGMVVTGMVTAWATGRVVRWRRAVRAEFARRFARDAVSDERLRIARELHDIVGHSMSLIAVKATVANHIADQRPDETRAALRTIEHTSRSALTEIRRLLDVLRADDDPAVRLAPSAGTADLADLAERLRSAGLRVELTLAGVEELPTAVDLSVYRIVQESLTNVLKHADAHRCRVTVRAAAGRVRVEVVDDGRGRRSTSRRHTGQGLIGMRERVTTYGGTLIAGPRPEGGYRVTADIPYVSEETA